MDQPNDVSSDLAIPSVIELAPMRFHVTRQPFDDYFTVVYFKDGRDTSEEMDSDETRAWFLARFKQASSREAQLAREEALEKSLDECWNFGRTVINIPADVYTEPVKRYPQYQPQV